MSNLPERAEDGKTYTAEELSRILYILQDRQQRDHKANVDRLVDAECGIDDRETEISDMNDKVDKIDDMESRVDTLESDVGDIDISDIESQISDLESKIDDLPDLEDIKADVGSHQEDIDNHDSRLDDLEGADDKETHEMPDMLIERVKEMEKKIFTYKELQARGVPVEMKEEPLKKGAKRIR